MVVLEQGDFLRERIFATIRCNGRPTRHWWRKLPIWLPFRQTDKDKAVLSGGFRQAAVWVAERCILREAAGATMRATFVSAAFRGPIAGTRF